MKVTFSEDLAACRLRARIKINAHAAYLMGTHKPDGFDAKYSEKSAQANAYLAAQSPNDADVQFSYIAAESAARSISMLDAANLIKAKTDQFRLFEQTAEQARLTANIAVDGATQPNQMKAAVEAFLALKAENI